MIWETLGKVVCGAVEILLSQVLDSPLHTGPHHVLDVEATSNIHVQIFGDPHEFDVGRISYMEKQICAPVDVLEVLLILVSFSIGNFFAKDFLQEQLMLFRVLWTDAPEYIFPYGRGSDIQVCHWIQPSSRLVRGSCRQSGG